MKIAFFVVEYYPRIIGGLGTYAVELTRQYAEQGHDVVVFTLNPGRQLLTHELWRGIFIHRPQITDLSSVFPLFVTEDLRKWGENLQSFCDVFSYNHLSATKFVNGLIRKEQEKYDIVAVHDWLSAPSGLIVKKELPQMPVVYHVHSTEQQRSQSQGSEVIRFFERQMADTADTVVTVSYAMKDYIGSIGYPKEKIRVAWNGVDPDKYSFASVKLSEMETLKQKYKIKPGERVLLFVGRLTRVKGVANLVQAMPQVLSVFPKTRLVILGVGEEYADLVQLTIRLGIADIVTFRTEFVPEHERIVHYAMSDVCVFPSITEPFGIVCLEAMAMGKPVVVGARGISGFREQVIPSDPGRTGIHVNAEDVNDISWGLKEALIDPEQAMKWGQNAVKRIQQYFTWKDVAENTLNIYQEAINKKG
ncbi:glycosyltransferase family 4 protein [Candidatus Bathyarchaeota archaeon]|nr:glycosyltransferase family 4 protein [Candidatus Bathyarchaeota archaeon]